MSLVASIVGVSSNIKGILGLQKNVVRNRRPPGGACPGSTQLCQEFLLRRAGSAGFDLGQRLGEHLLSVAPGLGQGPSNPSASTE